MLIEIAEVLSLQEVRRFRERLDSATWHDGRATAGSVAAGVKTNEQLDEHDPLVAEMGEAILSRLGQTPRFIAAALPFKILPPRFNRYRDGGGYGDHIDNAVFAVPGTRTPIRSDLSATLFLSDPDEYDGGELISENRQVKLPAGHMVLYSARTLHRVAPVTRGVRLASFFWVQSLVRDDDRRDELFELDEAIQALRADHPDHPSIVRLTGLYHNLLRDRAEV